MNPRAGLMMGLATAIIVFTITLAGLIAHFHKPKPFVFDGRAYSCAELVGPHPDESVAMLLPGWTAEGMLSGNLNTGESHQLFTGLVDPSGRRVCDRNGKDLR